MTKSGSERLTASEGERTRWIERCRSAVDEGRGLSLRIHTRSAAPEFGTREYHDDVLDLVRKLEDQGCVDHVEFDVWGKHVGTSPSSRTDEWTATAVEEYRAWADQRGVTLPFEDRQCNSMLIEDSYTVLVPPHLLVAVFEAGGEMVGLAPCVDDGGPTSVMDLLTLLRDHGRQDEQRASASA